MVSLLKVGLINYECSCRVWSPLCQLHFCRKCDKIKCPMCLNEEMDIVFCPNCLENNSGNDSQQRKFRCNVCNQCPLCGMKFLLIKIFFISFINIFRKFTCCKSIG